MSDIILEMLVILMLIVLNGFFAMAEIAIVSARKTRFQQLAQEGDARARTVLQLTGDPPRFLSTVQTGITLIGIFIGAFGGTTVAAKLSHAIAGVPFLAAYSTAIAVTVVVLIITFFSIILGELIPKQIGLLNSERIALAVARTMRLLSAALFPIVRVLSVSSRAVLSVFGLPLSRPQPVSEEEIKVMIDQGIEHGMFQEAERDMIEGVFTLGDKRVNELMTPRTDIVWLDVENPLDERNKRIRDSGHSRFPVCRGGLDTVLGVVRAKDILNCLLVEEVCDLTGWMQPPLYVPENALALKALETFKKARQHVALAVDEYGVVQGLITIYDILEAIVGDIPSVDEVDEPMAVKRADGSWLLDGLLPLDRFKEIFELGELPEEGSYQTLGGFIMMQLGRVPSPADFVDWGGLRMEVVDMEGNRVQKVLASPKLPGGSTSGSPSGSAAGAAAARGGRNPPKDPA
jgi:putative hemolysin